MSDPTPSVWDVVAVVGFTPEQIAASDERNRLYNLGRDAGLAGDPLPAGASEDAYLRASIERRGRLGEAVVMVTSATRCMKCGGCNWGNRGGCSCWPDGGWNFERNEREGYRVEWGAFVYPESPSADLAFMSYAELLAAKNAGRPVINSDTGEPITFESEAEGG